MNGQRGLRRLRAQDPSFLQDLRTCPQPNTPSPGLPTLPVDALQGWELNSRGVRMRLGVWLSGISILQQEIRLSSGHTGKLFMITYEIIYDYEVIF